MKVHHHVWTAAPVNYLSTTTIWSRQTHVAYVLVPMEVSSRASSVLLIELLAVVHLGHTDLPLAVNRYKLVLRLITRVLIIRIVG
jgi:hypothetical protein